MDGHTWSLGRAWWIGVGSLSGLFLVILLTGIVSIVLVRRIEATVVEAVRYDVALEHLGHELRLALLDLQLRHAELADGHPTTAEIAAWERSVAYLHETIAAVEQLGVRDPTLPQPAALRATAEAYSSTVSAAVRRSEEDPAVFAAVSAHGLALLAELERDARAVQAFGEQEAASALERTESTLTTAQLVLAGTLAGLALIGAGLAYVTVTVMSAFRRLYALQLDTARRLADALKAKSDFIADVSHELRTPLTVLRGNAQLALSRASSCAHTELLQDILSEADRLTRVVEDLLLLASAETASLPLVRERQAAGPFLARCADHAVVLVHEHGASLRVALQAEGWIDVDTARLERALLALVENAAKYSPPGGVVELTTTVQGDQLIVQIRDQGPGISEDDLPHVFERFYRADGTPHRVRDGTGLGLPIAQAIVSAHGGRIEVTSRPGRGTTVTVILPLAEPPQS